MQGLFLTRVHETEEGVSIFRYRDTLFKMHLELLLNEA